MPEIAEFNAQRLGRLVRDGNLDELARAVDGFLAELRQTDTTYSVRDSERSTRDWFGWADFRRFAGKGHEFASHTITYPHMTVLDEANIAYEIK